MPAHAGAQQAFNGNTLYAYCTEEKNRGLCFSYILGAADVGVFVENALVSSGKMHQAERTLCVPGGPITATQLAAIVVRHMERYPEKRHLGAGELVLGALSGAFPCKK